ncbi:hypothetical protein [Actinoplanes sp. NPDC026619]|uniref:hypothetical protein n=1 Tax=Actinoplanes sp. NPDC026619 TaxID=3155798 RepID=UPI0033E1576D
MKLARRRSLPAIIGLALTAGAVSIASPAHADDPENTAPTASYTLDSGAIWAGQRVTLTESGLTDDTTAPAAITRSVNWGDGSTDAGLTHTYASTGSYPVKVTLNDGTLDGAGVFTTGSTVNVTASPGVYAWQQPTIYTYPGYQEQGTMFAAALPANTRAWTAWTDGETSLLANNSSTTIRHWFGTGTWTPQITLQNGQGKATPRPAAPLTVLNDTTAPTASLTIPSSPNKASSWSTLRGRATDSESGIDVVGVQIWKWTSSTQWYYNFDNRTWVKDTGQNLPAAAQAQRPTDASGNWTAPVAGLGKGYSIQVLIYTWDKVGNLSDDYWSAGYALTS